MYQPVIGLEIHVQLATETKLFAPEATAFGEAPNSHVSAIAMAHPGTLPRINERAVAFAIRMGLATGCEITRQTYFDRKHYFYPDLPKGYQISQAAAAICRNGRVPIRLADGTEKFIRIHQIHLEEDAGKSIHDRSETETCIDLNRAGTPLIEIVSEPDMRSAEEAMAYVAEIRRLVRYLGISDGDMEKGNLRCDVNVSIRPSEDAPFGTRTETKNVNSITFVGAAIRYEAQRQADELAAGRAIVQQTRTFDPNSGTNALMRDKEVADDYRYFPEPDLPLLRISEAQLASIAATLPELPYDRLNRYRALGVGANEAVALTDDQPLGNYYDALMAAGLSPKIALNWLFGSVKAYLNEQNSEISAFAVSPERLAAFVAFAETGSVPRHAAREQLFPAFVAQPDAEPQALAETLGLIVHSQREALVAAMQQLIAQHPDEVARYRSGKKNLLGFFVGQLMRQFQGKVQPAEANAIAAELL